MESPLAKEIERYNKHRADLESGHVGEWAVVYAEDPIKTFQDFQDAANFAVTNYGRGPYLIRQVGMHRVIFNPISAVLRPDGQTDADRSL